MLAVIASACALHNRLKGGSHNIKLVDARPLYGHAVDNEQVHEYPGGRFIYRYKVAFFSWFNAEVRAVDIRNSYNPKEFG